MAAPPGLGVETHPKHRECGDDDNMGWRHWVPRNQAGRLGQLRQYLLHHAAAHVGQAVVAAGVAVGQPLVVEAQQVQDRRVQVVDVDLVLDRVPAELVGRAVDACRP